jgi:F-type H+-transporting ATPase subunit gamma
MANLKEIRDRLASVSSTRQITSAMKMVSAAKLRKAQDTIFQLRPYSNKLNEIFANISQSANPEEQNPYTEEREIKKVLIVPITSNRGLCGAFNTNVVKQSILLATETYRQLNEGNKVNFIAVGKKGADQLRTKKMRVIDAENQIMERISFEAALPLIEAIMLGFLRKEYDRVLLVYNQFKNAAVQNLVVEQILPVQIPEVHPADHHGSIYHDFIFEPSQETIREELVPKMLKIQFYAALLDSSASEHGARMTAMHKATDNATELLRELRLQYNKARQAAITNEILEITGGAEALQS